MPLDLTLDFAHALDPVAFAEDRLGFLPDRLIGPAQRQIVVVGHATARLANAAATRLRHPLLQRPHAQLEPFVIGERYARKCRPPFLAPARRRRPLPRAA
jgi:hypothetical protein